MTLDGKKVCGEVGEGDGEGLAEGIYFEIPEFSASRIVLRSAGHGWTGTSNEYVIITLNKDSQTTNHTSRHQGTGRQ